MRLPKFLRIAERWYVRTPDRALDSAYQSALKIQAIEARHFQGKTVAAENAVSPYSDRVVEYFQGEIERELKNLEIRLAEFQTALSIVPDERSPRRLSASVTNASEIERLRIEKLDAIDRVTARYRPASPQTESAALVPVTTSTSEGERATNKPVRRPRKPGKDRASAKTGAVPRSLLRTLDRIKREVDPDSIDEAEEEIIRTYRQSRGKTLRSIRFLLFLIVAPLLVFNSVKLTLIPRVETTLFAPETDSIFLSEALEEKALRELSRFEEDLHFRQVLGLTPTLDREEAEEKVREKAREIAEEYRFRSANAWSNWIADVLSLVTFGGVVYFMRADLAVFKSFLDEVIYGLSDSAKAFLIILFTDMFVGFHSPHGWEVILENVGRHFGLPESREFNFLFIATFPVILDTVLKYWIFRYLNRISPSAVATYRNMNE